MKKQKLDLAVNAAKSDFQAVLQTIVDELNQGQKKKLLKNEAVKSAFDNYGVKYE